MAIVLLATISHAGSFNFFKENSAISEQSLSEDKSMITEDQEYADLGCFQGRDTKLVKYLVKNQHGNYVILLMHMMPSSQKGQNLSFKVNFQCQN